MKEPENQTAVNLKPEICYFGTVSDSGKQKTFGILQEDRRKHMYILGKTGMGKTTLLQNMILQDIYNGAGVCFIDPHGDPSEYILDRIPAHRQNDIVYFNPADTAFPLGLNMLEPQRGEETFLIASGLIAVFHRIWEGMWSSRMEYILNNTLLALLETPGNTLLSIIQMLTDTGYRNFIIKNLKDPLVRNFWLKEFASFNDRYRQEAISPILNKIGQFLSTDLVRNIVGQQNSTIDFREIMDNQKILIVNLSKGRLGEDNSNLLGSLLVTKLQLAALSRVDIPENQRKDFYVYVDEFQNFTTESFATILSEARKYRLNLILAHQYIAQLNESGNEKVKSAIFGNVGTMISFRVGSDDAQILTKEFAPVFEPQELIGLDRTQIALSLSIRNKKSKPFLANTLAPIFDKLNGHLEISIESSRGKYGQSKALISERINQSFSTNYESKNSPKKVKNVSTETKQNPNSDEVYFGQNPNQQSQENRVNSVNKYNIKLPILPDTNLELPENKKTTRSLEALRTARNKIATNRNASIRILNGDLGDLKIDEENLFGLPNQN